MFIKGDFIKKGDIYRLENKMSTKINRSRKTVIKYNVHMVNQTLHKYEVKKPRA